MNISENSISKDLSCPIEYLILFECVTELEVSV